MEEAAVVVAATVSTVGVWEEEDGWKPENGEVKKSVHAQAYRMWHQRSRETKSVALRMLCVSEAKALQGENVKKKWS